MNALLEKQSILPALSYTIRERAGRILRKNYATSQISVNSLAVHMMKLQSSINKKRNGDRGLPRWLIFSIFTM